MNKKHTSNSVTSITIRTYHQTDLHQIITAVEDFQDYLIVIDPLQRLRRQPKYGQFYIRKFINSVRVKEGKIFVATNRKQIVGFIGGIIEKQTNTDLLGHIPSKDGRIIELFVSPQFRGKNIGKQLMSKMEHYFRKKYCTAIRIEVLANNNLAHNFYSKMNYSDRTIDMIKILDLAQKG